MPPLKHPKQEKFCLEYFALGNATEAAIIAGYKPRAAYAMGAENLKKPHIAARIKELQDKAESDKIMSVKERKERLSEIARARIADFWEADKNGVHIKVNLKTANSAAIQEVQTEFVQDTPIRITKLKLHDPVRAIAELNRMEKVYTDGQPEDKTPKVQVNVVNIETKTVAGAINALLACGAMQLADGERPDPAVDELHPGTTD